MAAPLTPRSTLRGIIQSFYNPIERDGGLLPDLFQRIVSIGTPFNYINVHALPEEGASKVNRLCFRIECEYEYLSRNGEIDLLAQAVFPRDDQAAQRKEYAALLSIQKRSLWTEDELKRRNAASWGFT